LNATTTRRAHPAGRAFAELAWHAVPPLAYFVVMLRFFPYWNATWLYSDEGYNLMKAMLVMRGYDLYSQVWSDQPPLLTWLLAMLFRVNGLSLYASRALILLFSCLMIWAAVQFMRLAWGSLPAVCAAVLLVLLPNFITLSAAALVGQPSLALAMVSMLCLGVWHRRRSPAFLLLSALALAASLLVKLFTAFLVPVFAGGLLVAEYAALDSNRSWGRLLSPALIWLAALASFTLVGGLLLVGPANLLQLILPHWQASRAASYPPNAQLYPITYYLKDAWAVLLLALLGAVYVYRERRWLMLYPLGWMLLAFGLLCMIKPVWFHHQLLVTLPAALLAGGAAGETLRLIPKAVRQPYAQGSNWLWLAGGLTGVLLVLATRAPQAVGVFRAQTIDTDIPRPAFEDKVARKIDQYKAQTRWMVTDMPMFAFQAGIPVPPELAVISWKRFAAGELTEGEILETVKIYQPEQVLIGRFELPALEAYLLENYILILEREDELGLYIRKDLLK
jgi:4-amino-4-deoxy-L-arabinose transferase-like glycosyltransferase